MDLINLLKYVMQCAIHKTTVAGYVFSVQLLHTRFITKYCVGLSWACLVVECVILIRMLSGCHYNPQIFRPKRVSLGWGTNLPNYWEVHKCDRRWKSVPHIGPCWERFCFYPTSGEYTCNLTEADTILELFVAKVVVFENEISNLHRHFSKNYMIYPKICS